MRNYITGDVILDAVVLPSGHVGDMKATTGPAPLRQAAMDALKQYQYAPAIQAGKPVQSHITITIKFWFDP
jgi:TonB family protein